MMQPRNIDHAIYVNSDAELKRLCDQWSSLSMLAMDTEFIRTDTFYPIGALLQVCDGDGCFLIDPLAINDLEPLKALLSNKDIVKVLHSCGEDLEVFDGLLGVLPEPLFDTQLAAAMDGYGFSLGYQRLVQAMLQVHIPKGETRSNWLQRPLSASQIHYAALDVAYLPEMYQRLTQSLINKGRFDWLQEECDTVLKKFTNTEGPESYYKKVKSAWRLTNVELAILRALTQWREELAQQRNVPRSRILKDRSCYEIARIKPKGLKKLSTIEDMTAKIVRENGEAILRCIKQAYTIERDELPERLPRPLPPKSSVLLKSLKALVKHRAEQLQIAQELLAKNRDYEALLRTGIGDGQYQLPPSLMGWRKAIIGDQLLDLLI